MQEMYNIENITIRIYDFSLYNPYVYKRNTNMEIKNIINLIFNDSFPSSLYYFLSSSVNSSNTKFLFLFIISDKYLL